MIMRWSIKKKSVKKTTHKKSPIITDILGDQKIEKKFAWTPILTLDKKTKILFEFYTKVFEYKEDKRPVGVKGTEYETVNFDSFRNSDHNYSPTVTKYKEYTWEPFNKWVLIDIK